MDQSEVDESIKVAVEKRNIVKEGTDEKEDHTKLKELKKHEFAIPSLPIHTSKLKEKTGKVETKNTKEKEDSANGLNGDDTKYEVVDSREADTVNKVSTDDCHASKSCLPKDVTPNNLSNNNTTDFSKNDALADASNLSSCKTSSHSSKNNTSKHLSKSGTSSPGVRKETSKTLKIEFPYNEPKWGGVPNKDKKYYLTVLKDGAIKDNINLSGKSRVTFGRHVDACDVQVEHPSCSRYHAVLQYCIVEKDVRQVGYYLYDLGSTHGCYVNKEKVKAKVYTRVRVGYQIKFGGSSRLYILEGPEDDQEEELDMSEVHQMKMQHKQSMAAEKEKHVRKGKTEGDEEGASWGFGEDAEEEELNLQELFEKKQSIEVKDPKKTLNGFFEREGIEFEYEMSQRGRDNNIIHVAQVRLPIESSVGVEVIAEGTSSNKRDAVLNCATDACKLIQAYDMMQNTCKEDQRVKRQRELEANDFYDSDDDNYLDRTGSVEKKRLKRKQWAGKEEKQETETHTSLQTKVEEKIKLLSTLEKKLNLSIAASNDGEEDDDSLDAFMSSMENKLDKKSESKMKREITQLKNEIEKLEKLVKKTKPALPTFTMEKRKVEASAEDNPVKGIVASNIKRSNDEKPVDRHVCKKEVHKVTSEEEPNVPLKKEKRMYGAASMPPKVTKAKEKKQNEADFVEWLPPKGQSGDGRTHLNDKLGY